MNDLSAHGIHPIRTYLMKSITLRSLRVFATPLDPYVLSIDVEGAELDVLRGNDWAEFTPPWAKVSEISEFLNLRGYELSDYVGLS